MASLIVPMTSSSRESRKSSVNRSSAAMSALLEQVDRALGAVGCRQARVALLARRHDAVAEHLPVTLVVLTEQVGGAVVAAAVPLTALGADLDFHCGVLVCAVRPAVARGGASAAARRASKAAHSSSSTACRAGGTSVLPIASRRQKWASAFGDSTGSSSPPAWARRTSSDSQSARSPM